MGAEATERDRTLVALSEQRSAAIDRYALCFSQFLPAIKPAYFQPLRNGPVELLTKSFKMQKTAL